MPNPIPSESRALVERRDHGMCFRCGVKGGDWHHRRTRSVKDAHQHCPCNGVYLHRACHMWVHKHPMEATRLGLIVSRYAMLPGLIPVKGIAGWWALDCYGHGSALAAGDVVFDITSGQPRTAWTVIET